MTYDRRTRLNVISLSADASSRAGTQYGDNPFMERLCLHSGRYLYGLLGKMVR